MSRPWTARGFKLAFRFLIKPLWNFLITFSSKALGIDQEAFKHHFRQGILLRYDLPRRWRETVALALHIYASGVLDTVRTDG